MLASANLNVITKAAERCGRILARDFREIENLQASIRGAEEFALRSRQKAEETLRYELTKARPNYGWATRADRYAGSDPTRYWRFSAVDGADNFRSGIPLWAVVIALEHKGRCVAGLVLEPVSGAVHHGEKGNGARVGDLRLRASACRRLRSGVVAVECDDGAAVAPGVVASAATCIERHNARFVTTGCPALALAWVAAGKLDGCCLLAGDEAAVSVGRMLVREAGGLTGVFDVPPLLFNPSSATPDSPQNPALVPMGQAGQKVQVVVAASEAMYAPISRVLGLQLRPVSG